MAERLADASRLMAKLREERDRQELTQEWVGDKIGVTKQSVQEFEAGKSRPSETTLRKWIAALGMPAEWADDWIEFQIGERVRDLLEARRGPRAPSPEDVEAAVRYVRRLFGR